MTTTKSANNQSDESKDSTREPFPGSNYLHLKRRFAHIARWLHTYLSMLSFAILLFFAVTGLLLNHAEWFDTLQRPAIYQGTLNKDWSNASDPAAVNKDEIEKYFRRTYRTKGSLSEFRVDGDQLEAVFKGPGYEADATIERATGKYELSVSPYSLVAVINDLHKGRNTGGKWSVVIDLSAILLTLVSLTGLTLIFFLNKRRTVGLLFLAAGALLCWFVYSLWVS